MKANAKKKPATPARVPAKSAHKTAARPAVKNAPKAISVPKVVARPVVKSVKAAAKPAKSVKPIQPTVKGVVKPAAASKAASTRPAPKKTAPVKPVAKPAAKKPSSKPAVPAASKKAVAQPVPAKTGASGKPAKPETKSVIKTIPKTLAKPALKTPAATPAQGVKVSAVKADKPPLSPAPAVQVAAPAVPQPGGLLPRPPLKPGRRSSARTASQSPPPAPMVPTHAPDAAKASYSTMTERVIAPPPQAAAKKDPKLAINWKTKAGEELTDDEVKAMPDAEYMNEKQMTFFRRKLSVLKQEIHNSAGETTEHLREDTVVVPDPADRATIEEEHALELRTRDRERKLLKQIEQSIARIDSGDYGYCDETGEAIGVGRLIARPTANLSLEAQQRRELKQKMFGD